MGAAPSPTINHAMFRIVAAYMELMVSTDRVITRVMNMKTIMDARVRRPAADMGRQKPDGELQAAAPILGVLAQRHEHSYSHTIV